MLWRSDNRYYGGGRGGYTSNGRGDRYHGGGRGGYTTGAAATKAENVTPAPAPAAETEPKRKT